MEPDQAKIDKLTKKLQLLREKLQAQAPAAAGWTCPLGGPGMGFGRGPAWGGRGQGWGPGGAGFGPGRGRGPGAGRGFGPGAGLGLGGGPGFVDRDKDGICDNYELRHGMHK